MIIKNVTIKNNLLILGKDIAKEYKSNELIITITNDDKIILSRKELENITNIKLCKRIRIYTDNRIHIPTVINFNNKYVQLKCENKENNIITYVRELN